MKLITTTIVLFFMLSFQAQEFSGKAIYKTSRKSSFKIGGKNNANISDKMKKNLEARLKKMNQKTFILQFDKFSSIYKEDVALSAPSQQLGGGIKVMSFGSGGSDIYYKNLKEKRFSNKTEIMGKAFLVKDNLQEFDWQLSSETKNIGNYTCYKATFSREVEEMKLTLEDGKPKEEANKKTITTTAWYTLQVPVSNGPGDYYGLPGLILEINDGKTTIVCTEIILNPKDEVKIEEPKKGKVVNNKKFEKITKEKSKEMMERFRSRRGNGNSIEIKIGG